ncbi:MAG: hydrolase, partial [Lachnospirales bacterium]
MNYELIINGVKGKFIPTVCGEVRLTSQRWGVGSLEFKVLKEGSIDFKEGNEVSFKINNKNMFLGYVFSKKRTKEGVISVLCYDQMRYLKNKDCYSFTAVSASGIFNTICNDYKIKVGTVENTGLILDDRIEDNT